MDSPEIPIPNWKTGPDWVVGVLKLAEDGDVLIVVYDAVFEIKQKQSRIVGMFSILKRPKDSRLKYEQYETIAAAWHNQYSIDKRTGFGNGEKNDWRLLKEPDEADLDIYIEYYLKKKLPIIQGTL